MQALVEHTQAIVEKIVREEWGQVLAVLVRYVRDIDLAEDVLQDACVAALEHWPRDSVPQNPRAWLLQTARRRAIDRFRRAAHFDERVQFEVVAALETQTWQDDEDREIADERLRLVFTCCHPALAQDTRVALTLKTLGGLTTPEIARAFLVSEKTMAQRLVRAKQKIKAAHIPYEIPPPRLWAERLSSVLAVIYLIFNEGYEATSGDALTRGDLCAEAIRLGQMLVGLVPEEPEVAGLLALMLLHEARRPARTDAAGDMLTLEQQDRNLWDRDQIEAGLDLLRRAFALGRMGTYQIQAAIGAVHTSTRHYGETDWQRITALYHLLYEHQPSPVVRLNAAAALSLAQGPDAGLVALDELAAQGELAAYQPFHAARADMLRRVGRREEAIAAYQRALELTANAASQRFLQGRLHEVLA